MDGNISLYNRNHIWERIIIPWSKVKKNLFKMNTVYMPSQSLWVTFRLTISSNDYIKIIGNIIRIFELNNNNLVGEDPWKDITAASEFAIHTRFHTTNKHSPGKLLFGKYMIITIENVYIWELISKRKHNLIYQKC